MPAAPASCRSAPMRKPKCVSGVGTWAANSATVLPSAIAAAQRALLIGLQTRDRRAEMRGGVVPEFDDARVTVERGLNDPALHAAAASMHEPNLEDPRFRGGIDILFDDRRNIAGLKGVQIELRAYWK